MSNLYLARVGTCAQVVLVGTCGEVARVALSAGTGQPTWPECLHDWDLSHAAAAAAKALAASSASFAHHEHPPVNLALPVLRGALLTRSLFLEGQKALRAQGHPETNLD
jgi:hypothetical protein